eukprot:SAG31_NODE_9985_length_1201_cov_0.994555_2_plen_128_part_01
MRKAEEALHAASPPPTAAPRRAARPVAHPGLHVRSHVHVPGLSTVIPLGSLYPYLGIGYDRKFWCHQGADTIFEQGGSKHTFGPSQNTLGLTNTSFEAKQPIYLALPSPSSRKLLTVEPHAYSYAVCE